jgi:hypothetical protein
MPSNISPETDMEDMQEGDETSSDMELCVPVDTLAIDGTRPEVGDSVDVKVGGSITRLVNDNAYVKVETVNGTPLPKPPLKPNPNVDEMSRLETLSKQYDQGQNS